MADQRLPTDQPAEAASTAPEAGIRSDLAAGDVQGTDAPAEIPSRQTVRMRVISERRGRVISAGFLCGAFNIERKNPDGMWEPLVLGVPFQCGCDCPKAGSAHPTDLTSLSSFGEFTWDAREQVVYSETRTCGSTPGGWAYPPVQVLRSVAQPVPPGHYRVTMSVLDALPTECTAPSPTSSATCQYPMGEGSTPTDYSLCPGDRTAHGEFDLASSDVEVDLLI